MVSCKHGQLADSNRTGQLPPPLPVVLCPKGSSTLSATRRPTGRHPQSTLQCSMSLRLVQLLSSMHPAHAQPSHHNDLPPLSGPSPHPCSRGLSHSSRLALRRFHSTSSPHSCALHRGTAGHTSSPLCSSYRCRLDHCRCRQVGRTTQTCRHLHPTHPCLYPRFRFYFL